MTQTHSVQLGTGKGYFCSCDIPYQLHVSVYLSVYLRDIADAYNNQMLLAQDKNMTCSSLALTCLWNADCHSQ